VKREATLKRYVEELPEAVFQGPASAHMTILDGNDITAYIETQSGISFFDPSGNANFEVGSDGIATVNVWGEGTVTFKFNLQNTSDVNQATSEATPPVSSYVILAVVLAAIVLVVVGIALAIYKVRVMLLRSPTKMEKVRKFMPKLRDKQVTFNSKQTSQPAEEEQH